MIVPAEVWHPEIMDIRGIELDAAQAYNIPLIPYLKSAITNGRAWTAIINNEPIAIWGIVQEEIMGDGRIWFVASESVQDIPKQFLRESKWFIQEIKQQYSVLIGYVDKNYEISKRWMQWLGFIPVEVIHFHGKEIIKYELRYGH